MVNEAFYDIHDHKADEKTRKHVREFREKLGESGWHYFHALAELVDEFGYRRAHEIFAAIIEPRAAKLAKKSKAPAFETLVETLEDFMDARDFRDIP